MAPAGDGELLRQAVELARRAVREGGGPFGAVVAREGRVLGLGTNRVVEERDPSAHAELLAIRAACRALSTHDLSGCVIYSSCEPCPMCLGAILWSRLDRLVYAADRDDAAAAGFDDRRFHEELDRPRDARSLPTLRLLLEEARLPFEDWLAKADRRRY